MFLNEKEEVERLYLLLEIEYPNSKCMLYYKTALGFFVSATLSSQISDTAVNKVARRLFYDNESDDKIYSLSFYEIMSYLYPLGFYRVKSNFLYRSLKIISTRYGGIPRTYKELIQLPGVGSKIARVILSNLFRKNYFPVDRHILRIFSRVYNISIKNPDLLSKTVEEVLSDRKLGAFSNRLIEHGRQICRSQKPLCNKCIIVNCKSRILK